MIRKKSLNSLVKTFSSWLKKAIKYVSFGQVVNSLYIFLFDIMWEELKNFHQN